MSLYDIPVKIESLIKNYRFFTVIGNLISNLLPYISLAVITKVEGTSIIGLVAPDLPVKVIIFPLKDASKYSTRPPEDVINFTGFSTLNSRLPRYGALKGALYLYTTPLS